jgi:hypothetical protein
MCHKKIRVKVIERDQYKCVWCGVGETYNDKPLTLQVDHIDGNRKNNNLDNLRTLCPNCHSQTETYTFNKTKSTFENKLKTYISSMTEDEIKQFFIDYSYDEIVEITGTSLRTLRKYIKENNIICRHKLVIHNKKLYLSKEELQNLMKDKTFYEIGSIYNVSDTSVRKLAKKYKLYFPKTYKPINRKNLTTETKRKISIANRSNWITE